MLGDSGPPPASRNSRFDLPLVTVENHNEVCVICQENFEPKAKAKMLPCRHFLHYDCAMEWLEKRNSCPTCRLPLPSEKIYFDDISDKIEKRSTDKIQSALYS